MSGADEQRPQVAVTLGDPNGIGPEVVLKALQDVRVQTLTDPVLVGSKTALRVHSEALDLPPLQLTPSLHARARVPQGSVRFVDTDPQQQVVVQFGSVTPEGGQQAMRAVESATDLALQRKVSALATAPISKKAISLAGYTVPGHTEFLAEQTGAKSYVMMLVSGRLRVAPLTGHRPLAHVAKGVRRDAILNRLVAIDASLRSDFGIAHPTIAVLGLNPHAGEDGMLGREEAETIVPAIEDAGARGLMAFGPFAADGYFGSTQRDQFDAVLAMYHDQGLAPFKALAFGRGVNFTAGLPIVRTSCDHGTAFAIAGQNKADAGSMAEAILLAARIGLQRGP